MPFSPDLLQFGALGLLAVVIVMNYQMGKALLREFTKTLEELGSNCHKHGTSREERLIGALEKNASAYERAILSNERVETLIRNGGK